jgi:hypothetical protein
MTRTCSRSLVSLRSVPQRNSNSQPDIPPEPLPRNRVERGTISVRMPDAACLLILPVLLMSGRD